MIYIRTWFVFLLSMIYLESHAQIQITFPVSRIVFQRNNQNQANVNIAGSYFQQLDRIEFRAIPVWGGQGNETGWNPAQEFRNNGIFGGTLLLNGGWYNIEVRGILNGNVVTATTLERVGVGEVFIVAGQSNAQGDNAYPGATNGASDDRVSTINFYDPALNESNLPFQFSQMGNNTRMAPYNYVPWFWARLGDKLTQRLNVPVLFYGAALGGLSCDVWRRSVEGQDLRQELPTFVKVSGMPYRGMKAALQHYVTRTGVRAILWQQGESDANFSSDTYFNNLRTVIEKSRSDTKKGDLAWVVARSSRNPVVLNSVIAGQNLAIQRIGNVFAGPTTDDIVGSNLRIDGIHFYNEGLSRAADFWSNSLDGNFFNNAQPLLARPLPSVNIACNLSNATNRFTVSTGGYVSYRWSNGGTANFISASSGTFSFTAQDDVGNTVFSQPLTLSTNNNVSQPLISVNGATVFCDGGATTLTSNVSGGNVWSNGERGQSISVRSSGNYSVSTTSLNGCVSPVSNAIGINVLPAPFNQISTNKSLPICPDESIELFTNNDNGLSYQWSTNESQKRITVNNIGSYSLRIKGQNGCESQSSINVSFRARPTTTIQADGETTFCLGKSVNIFPQGDFQSYSWSNGATSKSTNIRTGGVYSLRVKDNFGCLSDLTTRRITVNALPVIKIKAEGADKFCEGNTVSLSPITQTASAYRWSTGETSSNINVSREGIYTLSVQDANGCESLPDTIRLNFIPLPIATISTAGNINTICDGSALSLLASNAASYSWSTGSNTKDISVSKAGVYSLKIKDDKNCESKPVNFELMVKNNPAAPDLIIAGAFQLEAIPAVFDNAQTFNWKQDDKDISAVSAIYKAAVSAKYAARTVLKYTLPNNSTLLCYSPYSKIVELFIPYLDKGLRIYPNPNPNGVFTVETLADNPNANITVFTLSGKIVFTGQIADLKEKRVLDLRVLEAGSYIIRLSSGAYEATTRIVIK